VALFLTRGRVCNLLLLLVLASAVPFLSESCGTLDHILLSQFLRLPQTWRTRSPYLYPTGTGWPRYTPGHCVPFPLPLTTRRATVKVFNPSSTRPLTRQTWEEVEVEVEVNLRPTVSRPVCPGVRPPSGTRDQLLILLEISFRQLRRCYFVAPSLTRGRVYNLPYNCFWALPEQSLLGRSPAELTTIFYCLI
jgi:hypothetical protein